MTQWCVSSPCAHAYLHIVYTTPPLQTIVMQMGDQDMDSIVLAVGQRKTLSAMHKEYEDLVSVSSPTSPPPYSN